MKELVLTLNAGSSSVKFALFHGAGQEQRRIGAGQEQRRIAAGQVEGLGSAPRFAARTACGETSSCALPPAATHEEGLAAIIDWVRALTPARPIAAIGHRIVHGGARRAAPVLLDDPIVAELRALAPLAPLHQPHNLAGVDAARKAFPAAPQIACFDTAFHRGHGFVHDAYALPREFYERGLRRFGFHGLSYEYIARRLRDVAPKLAQGRVVVAHLGAGASLCAMRRGRSVAATMGFSPLDGLPGGTRCGQIDPGLLLHLMTQEGMSAEGVSKLLYHRSGLLGLSGVSNDMRALEASNDPRAKQAIDYFAARLVMEIAAMAAALSGIDALVFTAGIGEHSAALRARVVGDLRWMGLALDEDANARHAQIISPSGAAVAALVVPTDEEAMIAAHVLETVGAGS